jgi:hypothetical protein
VGQAAAAQVAPVPRGAIVTADLVRVQHAARPHQRGSWISHAEREFQKGRRMIVGAGDRIRTDNIQLGKLAFYIELRPLSVGEGVSKGRILFGCRIKPQHLTSESRKECTYLQMVRREDRSSFRRVMLGLGSSAGCLLY